MAGAVSVHGNEGQFDPVLVTVPIRPTHSDARLSLLGFFSIGTVPFPHEHFAFTPSLGVPEGSLRYRELTNPLLVPGGGGLSTHRSQYK